MKPKVLTAAIGIVIWASCLAQAGQDVVYSKTSWNGIPAHVVTINLNSPDVKVTAALARNGAGTSESFSSMLNRLQPAAAITGTFFCTRSLLPTGDIVIEGMPVYTGCIGKSMCITPANTVEFIPYKQGHRAGWAGFETVLSAGPTLVQKGTVCLFPRDEGFKDPSLFGRRIRTAVGVTANNQLLLVAVQRPVYMKELAKIMHHLGAVDAVDLDGGSSTALYCNGKQIARPGRRLTNLLVVYENQNDYNTYRQALAPQLRKPSVVTPKTIYAMNPFDNPFTNTPSVKTPDIQVLGTLMEYHQWMTSPTDQKLLIQNSDSSVGQMNPDSPKPSPTPIDLTPCLLQVLIPGSKAWPQVSHKKPTDKKHKHHLSLTPEHSHWVTDA